MLSLDGPAIRYVHFGQKAVSMFRSWLSDHPVHRGEGYAVLRWWPNGAHDLFGFSASPRGAQERLERVQRSWKHSPQAPTGWAVVPASWAQVRDHDRYGCTRTHCTGAGRIERVGEQAR